MRIGVTRIAGKIGALVALLVVLSAVVAHPSSHMPLAGALAAEATIDGPAHPGVQDILPPAAAERASLRAIDAAGPDPLWVRAMPPQPSHQAPPRASARCAFSAPACALAGERGCPAHPPRAPPFA